MNILATNEDPLKAATELDNIRLNCVAIKETAQMLSTALRAYGCDAPGLYQPTHGQHACALWARRTRANFLWLVAYAHGAEHERVLRSARKPYKPHASMEVVKIAMAHEDVIPMGPFTPFPNTARRQELGIDCRVPAELATCWAALTAAMRRYLCARWTHDLAGSRKPRFGTRGAPDWAPPAIRNLA